MIVSPRLTRAAFAFLLFGTAAALLPAQDMAVIAANGCFTGPAGSAGQLAIAPSTSAIQSAYTLTPTAVTYSIYFKPDAASPYVLLKAGNARTSFVINSGQAAVNGVAYSAPSQPATSAPSFTAAQAASYVGKTTYYPGTMTATTTYLYIDPDGKQTTYTAAATFSTS